MIKSKRYWLIALFSLLLASTAQAGIVGTWPIKGVLNVTFKKPNHIPVKTVSNLDESWVFKADKTFTQGSLAGTWVQNPIYRKLFVASFDLSAYETHLIDFWAARGVTISNVHILRNKLEIRKVSNGLSGEGILKYEMDVTENSGVQTTTVIIRSSFVSQNNSSQNAALSEFFPTLLPEEVGAIYGSGVTNVVFSSPPFVFQGP